MLIFRAKIVILTSIAVILRSVKHGIRCGGPMDHRERIRPDHGAGTWQVDRFFSDLPFGRLLSLEVFGRVAQMVEQWTENPCVGGSIPSLSTPQKPGKSLVFYCPVLPLITLRQFLHRANSCLIPPMSIECFCLRSGKAGGYTD